MDKDKIKKAAQLSDDLKKVNRALGLFGEDTARMAVRLSNNIDGVDTFAYLPKSVIPAIYTLLAEAKEWITKEMEDL